MKLTIVHGSPRGKNSNTYHLTYKVVKRLEKEENVVITEFFPSKDFPDFCVGCYNCILRDEKKCPHRLKVAPIEEAMLGADAIIFSSPVYVMDLSGQMKVLLDHFGYQFIIHRADPLFTKIPVMIVSTTAGAGTNHLFDTIKRPLKYWGIPKIYKLGIAMFTHDFSDYSEKKLEKLNKKVDNTTKAFYKSIKNRDKLKPNWLYRFMKILIKSVIKKQNDDNPDKVFWRKQGWLK